MLRARAGAARGLAVGARRALSTAAAPISSRACPSTSSIHSPHKLSEATRLPCVHSMHGYQTKL